MSTIRLSFWVALLAIINAYAGIQIVLESSGLDLKCLERAQKEDKLEISVCNRENLRQQFYISGDLTKWDSASVKENDIISGPISTECGPENMKFLNEAAGFSTDPFYFNFKLMGNDWQIQLNSDSTKCLKSTFTGSREGYADFQNCHDDNYSFRYNFADFEPEPTANCD